MNFDFSIESSLARINNINTRTYFNEVYQTFVSGNYRSSTVMLYSVLICDLVYKLRDLRDIYNDSKAKKIIEEIEALQKANPTSPDWESKLIEFIRTRTSLFEPSDIIAIESLQKFRHLSAHPVLNNADLLYSPNKETVQSLIRNILEGVLTNPPFFSNKIFDLLLQDLAEVKNRITDDESLDKYIKSRYFKNLKENDFKKVFRSLWKIVFIATDKEATENGNINYRALRIFTQHNKGICINLLKSEPIYYSNINNDDKIGILIHYLAFFPEIYHELEPPLELLIDKKINEGEDYKLMAWFVKPSLEEHLKGLDVGELGEITEDAFNYVKDLAANNLCSNELINFAIRYFGSSHSFDNSQRRYKRVLLNIVDNLTIEQTKQLLLVTEDNNQIYHSFGMKPKIRAIAEKYDAEIDKADYPTIYPA